MTILTSILTKTKMYLFLDTKEEKDWREALKLLYNDAVRDGAISKPVIGSSLEHEIATGLSLDSNSKNRSAVASMSVT